MVSKQADQVEEKVYERRRITCAAVLFEFGNTGTPTHFRRRQIMVRV